MEILFIELMKGKRLDEMRVNPLHGVDEEEKAV